EFEVLLGWREKVTKALEPFRAELDANKKAIHGRSTDAKITLQVPKGDRALLDRYASELADLFIVSEVAIAEGNGTVAVEMHRGVQCERCWKYYAALAKDPNDVCTRCAAALAARKS